MPVSPWQELIDLCPGRAPVVRATGRDIVYEFCIQGGVMRDELFRPSPHTRVILRCDDADNLTARITNLPRSLR